jgi:hypothetical protein
MLHFDAEGHLIHPGTGFLGLVVAAETSLGSLLVMDDPLTIWRGEPYGTPSFLWNLRD